MTEQQYLDAACIARAAHAERIGEWELAYNRRVGWRPPGQPVVAFLGYGRAGKDEAAEWLGGHSSHVYGGSSSSRILPLVATALGVRTEVAWEQRHNNREYWFEFCNALRKYDPTCIVRWSLAYADTAVGIRAKYELLEAVRLGILTHTVWIDNPRVPVDSTVTFNREDCMHVLPNAGSLMEYHANLATFCRSIGIQIMEK